MGETQQRRVLVVDDEEDVRTVLRILLEEEGWEVECAATVEAARASLAERMPHVLLLDLGLGTRSGAEILAELSLRPDAPDTVLVSGKDEVVELAMRYGNLPIVRKPFDVEVLMAAVDYAVQRHKRPSLGRISAA